MKLQPIKNAKLPKYAAALAAIVSGAVLTACGKTQLGGDVPVPIQESRPEENVEYNGDIWGSEESAPPVDTSTETEELWYEGDVFENEEPAPDAAFAQQSREVLQKAAAGAGLSDLNNHTDTVQYHGCWTPSGFRDTKHHIMICFFDGTQPVLDPDAESVPDIDNMNAWYAHFAKQTFDWGYADVFDPKDYPEWPEPAAYRAAFVDISKYETMTEENAKQILSDLLALETESAGEEDIP